MECNDIKVGIADYKVGKIPDKLITIGLGSCVGIALQDKKNGIAGLAHIMLPNSENFSNINNPIKFSDLAIPILIKEMLNKGAQKKELKAKIAGGASMFNFTDSKANMDIGARNSASVKSVLKEEGIPIISEDIGGTKGRTITFDSVTGDLQVKTVGEGIKVI